MIAPIVSCASCGTEYTAGSFLSLPGCGPGAGNLRRAMRCPCGAVVEATVSHQMAVLFVALELAAEAARSGSSDAFDGTEPFVEQAKLFSVRESMGLPL